MTEISNTGVFIEWTPNARRQIDEMNRDQRREFFSSKINDLIFGPLEHYRGSPEIQDIVLSTEEALQDDFYEIDNTNYMLTVQEAQEDNVDIIHYNTPDLKVECFDF